MAKIGNGYGSEFHLLRYLGYHRHDLNRAVEKETGARVSDWLDFAYSDEEGLDREWNRLMSSICCLRLYRWQLQNPRNDDLSRKSRNDGLSWKTREEAKLGIIRCRFPEPFVHLESWRHTVTPGLCA